MRTITRLFSGTLVIYINEMVLYRNLNALAKLCTKLTEYIKNDKIFVYYIILLLHCSSIKI